MNRMKRMSRRAWLGGAAALAASAGAGALIGPIRAQTHAAPRSYRLEAVEIAARTWCVYGAQEDLSRANGGAIANAAFIQTPDGVVVVDTGPSKRYGEALAALIAEQLPGKRILRVFNTHHHPDHVFGNQAFPREALAAPQAVIEAMTAQSEALAANMYRILGDWMRGTVPTPPGRALNASREEIGGRVFTLTEMKGHTACDLVVRDEETGLVFAGDLAFLDRAPTTPNADLPAWRASLAALRRMERDSLLPGHGPVDPQGASLDQTLDWLDWLDGTLREAVARGLTMNEAMAAPIPARFAALGVARTEFERSVVHLRARMEEEILNGIPPDRL